MNSNSHRKTWLQSRPPARNDLSRWSVFWAVACVLVLTLANTADAAKKSKKKKRAAPADPYADLVWPPPPDEARIKLDAVLTGRTDIEAKSRLRRILIGAAPQSPYDTLRKPFAVAFDSKGRILVTDWGTAAVVRFDRLGRRFDVLGTRGNPALKQPLGLAVGSDDSIYVADVGLRQVVKMDSEGKILKVYGRSGDLVNPTDAAVSPDGAQLYVTDSKQHRIVIFDEASGEFLAAFGKRGSDDGDFHFPTSLAFDGEGNLLVVDQLNARVQLLAPDGEYLDAFGGRGVGFGNFSRPKDVAVDDVGFIYVTDNAFNNLQVFDADFTLLSFIGETGSNPGRFWGASGVAVRGDDFAVVDQIGARVQVFRYLEARKASIGGTVGARAKPPVTRSPAPAPAPAPAPIAEAGPTTVRPRVSTPAEPAETVSESAQVENQRTQEKTDSKAATEVSPTQLASSVSLEPAPEPEPEPEPEKVELLPVLPVAVLKPAAALSDLAEEVAHFVESWHSAWTKQQVAEYLASYTSEYRPASGLTRKAWEQQRRERLTRPRFIEVRIEDLSIDVLGPTVATANFVQSYRSNTFGSQVRKTLRLIRDSGESDGWFIIQETVETTLSGR